ncbi:MAG: hypothetical protein V1775_07450 [Bacteroidota bacterium]
MKKTLKSLKRSLGNIPGWRTDRQIIVFESDDWGSIRMPSENTYNTCLKNGYRVDRNIFSRYDSLASVEDLTLLFDLLLSYRDKNHNPPVFTANCLVTNPDFEKIRKDNFENYHYEHITDTFKRYPEHSGCFGLWKKGMDNKVFRPQSHGREHLNVSRFLNDLNQGNKDAHFAFNHEMPGIFAKDNVVAGNNYVVALEYNNEADKTAKGEIIREGLRIFSELFGYESSSFIATNYIWAPEHEKVLSEQNVRFIQGSKFQLIPKGEYGGFSKKYHFTGQKNNYGQFYLARNAYFEPALNHNFDWVSSCMKEIENAFFWKKPAIVSTHRINYVGFIDRQNRDQGLFQLKDLLDRILLKWPDAEFLSTDELGCSMLDD